MEPIRLSPVTSNEFQAPGPRVMVRVRPGEIGLDERPEAPSVKAPTYRAAVLFFILAAVAFVPFILAPVNGSVSGTAGSADHANGLVSAGPRPLSGGMVVSSDPRVVRNATNLIGDGTFDAIPGPWIYTNGTTGAVTASRDPTARARLGHTTPVLRFDSMDDVFGSTLWTSAVSNPQSSSNPSQETAIRSEGTGSLKDEVTIAQNNQWAGAIRDDPLRWNWSGYDRLAIRMDKATPGTLWAWVYVQDETGGNAWGLFSLVTGWYRYPVDLNAPLDVSNVTYVEVAFAGAAGTTGTVYVDDIVLFNSTSFAESARVAQTFTKSTPTSASPNSLRLVFDLEATTSSSVVANLEVTIGNIVEWSETPVAQGTRTVEVDLSGDAALQATGSFSLAVSLRLNRTGWEPDGNPVPLTVTNWSSTIGQIVAVNSTAARFEAPTQPGTGVVSATQGTIRGSANVTVEPPIAVVPPTSPWDTMLWPGFAMLVSALGAAGFVAIRRSAKHAFRIEDLFLINREGLLIAHTTSRRDSHGDEDILAGMLTAIMSFAQDVFQEEIGGLRQFEIGNKTVALEPSEHVYVAAIGSGPIRNRLSTSLRDFLVDIEERYGDRLQWWSGMNEDLLGIDAMVQVFARRERYHRGDWKRHAAPGAGPKAVEKPEGPGPAIHLVIVPKEPMRPL